MSTVGTRLQKIAPALTAKERTIIALRAQAAGEEFDQKLREIADPTQRRLFYRYMGLNYVINRQLGGVCNAIEASSYALRSNAYVIGLLRQGAGFFEAEHGLAPVKGSRNWRKRAASVPEFLRGLAEELRVETLSGLEFRWQEARALEIVWVEAAAEFDGVDPVEPELRARHTATIEALRGLAAELGGKRRLPEPDERVMEHYREITNQGIKSLGFAGLYE